MILIWAVGGGMCSRHQPSIKIEEEEVMSRYSWFTDI